MRRVLNAVGALLLATIFFPLPISYALPSNSLVESHLQKTFYAGKGGELTLDLTQKPEGTSVALMPGAPYEAGALHFSDELKNLAPGDSGLFLSLREGKLFFLPGSGPITEKASLIFSGKRVSNLLVSGDSLYFSQGKSFKKATVGGKNDAVVSEILSAGKTITSLYVEANAAYLVLEERELVVLDLNSDSSAVLDKHVFDHDINKLIVKDGICYVTSKTEGLVIIDATRPGKMIRRGNYKTTGPALDLALIGGHAFIADGWTGVTILNISAPSNIIWKAGLNSLGYVEQIKVEGGYIAVKNSIDTITFIDATHPERPKAREHINFRKDVSDYAIFKETLYVLEKETLKKVSFKDIRTPEYLNDGVNLGGSRRAFFRNGVAYVADWFSGLHIYDINDPRNPGLLSAFPTPGSPKGVLVDGDIAFVGDDDHGLQIINIADPQNPFLVSNLRMPGLAYTMRLRGHFLYIAMHRGGIHIVDISDLEKPNIVGTYDTPGKSWSLEFSKENLFVTDDNSGVLVLNVEDPKKIVKIGEFNPGGFAEDILIKDNLAYVVFFDQGLYVVDISNPANPIEVSHLKTPGNARGIDIQDDYAYIADWFAGFHIVDISSPVNPKIVSSYDTDGGAWGITRRGNYIFLLDWWGGLKVFDASNLKNTKPVGKYHRRGTINDIKVNGNLALLANGSGGLQIYDLKNPLFPVWVTGVDLPGSATSLDLEENSAYVALGSGGVSVINIENPLHPIVVNTEQTPGVTKKILASQGFLYVSDDRAGLIIYEISPSGGLKNVFNFKAKITDFTVSWDGVYLITGDGQVLWAEKTGDFQFNTINVKGEMPSAPALIRVSGNQASVAGKEGGVHLFRVEFGTFVSEEVIALADKVLDIKITSERLLVLGENTGLMEFELTEKKVPHLRGVYKPVRRMTRIETTKSYAFLAGEKNLTSLKYLPPLSGLQTRGKSITLKVPSTLPVGNYNLVINSGEKSEILQNAIKVVRQRLTPRFTLKEYQKILEERKAKELRRK